MLFGRKSRAVESAAKDEDLAWRLDAIGQNVATIRFTPDGQILSANPLFLAVVGYSADELVGKHHRIFCEEDFQASAAYVRFWKELASGTPQRGVFKRLRRDGTPVWLEATYFPVKNAEGAVVEVLKIAADVTRNHSELLLLNAINDAIRQSMAVIEFTPDGEILDANENFLRLFGYSLKSLKGQHHRMLCFDEFYRENPDFWARLRHGEFSRGHFERRSAAGERVHIEATYNPVKDSSGRIIKVIKFAIDVTEQVNRNEEVRRAAELSFSTAEETAQISTRGIDSLDQSVALSAKTLSMVNTAVGLISQLTHQTKDIENIVTTIQSVAEQTNLLALNRRHRGGSRRRHGARLRGGRRRGAATGGAHQRRHGGDQERGHRERQADPADQPQHADHRVQRPGEQQPDHHRGRHHAGDQQGRRARGAGGVEPVQVTSVQGSGGR